MKEEKENQVEIEDKKEKDEKVENKKIEDDSKKGKYHKLEKIRNNINIETKEFPMSKREIQINDKIKIKVRSKSPIADKQETSKIKGSSILLYADSKKIYPKNKN